LKDSRSSWKRLRRVIRITRTVIVRSTPLPRRVFRVFVELEGMYRNMVEQLVVYAVRNGIGSFVRLKALRYREMRGSTLTCHPTMLTRRARMLVLGLRASSS